MRNSLFVWWLVWTITLVQSTYSPVLSWDVCSPSRIVVTLSGAEEGGIIYIRGYGAACRQTTSVNRTQHVFDFQSCGIITGETYFTIIVQKNPLYQTGSDLQESLLCIYDLSDISVGNSLNVGDKDDDEGVNKTVKPIGTMILYKDGQDIGGQSVKLSDMITMTVQLDEQFRDDFDIKAISCTANFLDLIQNFCAVDTALFPNFQHVSQAVITSTFGAFRTTDLGGGFVEMIYSCTVQVCLGQCTSETCTNSEIGWGRRRRAVSDVTYDEINIGASFSVGNDEDNGIDVHDSMNHICIDNTVFILLLLTIVGVLVMSLSLTVHVTTKLLKRNDELRSLTGINTRQRKSLVEVIRERRRSSIPIAYRNSLERRKTSLQQGFRDDKNNSSDKMIHEHSTIENEKGMNKAPLNKAENFHSMHENSSRSSARNNITDTIGTHTKVNAFKNESKRASNPPHMPFLISQGTLPDDSLDNRAMDCKYESLLGLKVGELENMSIEQKKRRIAECVLLLNRLSKLQKPIHT